MIVAIDGAEHSATHEGATHYFCSPRCHDKFVADPELYLSGAHLDAVEDVPEGTIYTCPMHPERVTKSIRLDVREADQKDG